jgi:hypothetical protein
MLPKNPQINIGARTLHNIYGLILSRVKIIVFDQSLKKKEGFVESFRQDWTAFLSYLEK